MFTLDKGPYWAELSHAGRLRVLAEELALAGWPRWLTEALQGVADALEET